MNRDKIYLELGRVVSFSPKMAKALGGINEALFVQQLYYWSDKGSRSDGYIWKTKDEIQEEIFLTREQQDKVVKRLKSMGLLLTKLKKADGGNPTLHYKLDIPLVQKTLNETCETHETNSVKDTKPVTENTTENTTENYITEPEITISEPVIVTSKKIKEVIEINNTAEAVAYLLASPMEHIRLIGIYIDFRKIPIFSYELVSSMIKRNAKVASTIVKCNYPVDLLKKAFEYCNTNYPPDMWKLETVLSALQEGRVMLK